MSNLVNSGINSIYILVQYKSQSLIEHIRNGWVLAPIQPRHFITVVPPQMLEGPEWFQGTADAVYQNTNLIEPNDPDLVAVFGADHIYRMDVRAMARFHQERAADITISALPVPLAEASAYGVISIDADGRVTAFDEKPAHPTPMPGHPAKAFASMGNYLFSTEVLLGPVREACEAGDKDFGRHVLPRLVRTHRVYAYDFSTNIVPGLRPYEEQAYWRDVGTIEQYYAANLDTLGLEPMLNLFNPRWPIFSSHYQGPIAHLVKAQVENSDIAAGSLVHDAVIRNSLIRREVVVEEDVVIEDSIILDATRDQAGRADSALDRRSLQHDRRRGPPGLRPRPRSHAPSRQRVRNRRRRQGAVPGRHATLLVSRVNKNLRDRSSAVSPTLDSDSASR